MLVKSYSTLKYIKIHSSSFIKVFAFLGLGVAGYIDLIHSEYSLLQDPFLLGAFSMAIASLLTLLNPKIYYIHTAMFFFIITKVISQFTHSKHYDIWGHVRH
jgi:hypothetical protein